MVRKTARLVLGAAIAASAWMVVGQQPASAHCEFETPDGGCSNSCTEMSKAFTKITKKAPPWECTQ